MYLHYFYLKENGQRLLNAEITQNEAQSITMVRLCGYLYKKNKSSTTARTFVKLALGGAAGAFSY